ncbi:MAG: bifunctional phosphoribosyl-AMP cyclohydrolase/phosphoribosyl-ATP diphosphatase HisIE [Paramuribaculum sp.]|nr:bifunctional phosphoribosyl-AMP cyclohydrolase/phosphoribosyl-ATP diphosphatase HisIE [Paramuribaculum sp.]
MISFDKLTSDRPDGLIPAIVQDADTLKVLMLGYMDREAFDTTIATGKVTFYSRSRQTQWTKGETSGNFLRLVNIHADCDNDTLLVEAHPMGPTCHKGTTSCFQNTKEEDATDSTGFIRALSALIQGRHKEMPQGSYTTRLFEKGVDKIAQKVGEEAVETVIEAVAGRKDGLIYEASDLVYHLLVLLEATGLTIADIEKELKRRHE